MNDVQFHVLLQTNLKSIMLNNRSETQKNGHSRTPFIQNSKAVKTETYIVKITIHCLGNHSYIVKPQRKSKGILITMVGRIITLDGGRR